MKVVRRVCRVCGKVFLVRPSRSHQEHCSKKCGDKSISTLEWMHPELKLKAKEAVARAIKLGELAKQPCRACGSTECLEAHHQDYTKPLEILWLCKTHHKQWHRYLNRLEEIR